MIALWQDLVVKNGRKYLARSFHIICTEKIAILFLRCNEFDSKMLIFYTESFDKKLPLDPILHSYSGANNMLSHLYSIPFLFIEGTLNTNRYFLLIWSIRQSYTL